MEPDKRGSEASCVKPPAHLFAKVALGFVAAFALTASAGAATQPSASRGAVVEARAGGNYLATATVRSRAGRRLCLKVRETRGRTRVGAAKRCLRATGRWQRFRPVRYRAKSSGTRLSLKISAPSSRVGFAAKALSLRLSCSRRRNCKPPPPPPPPVPPPP